MRSLFPSSGAATISELWNLSERNRHAHRPWVIMCMLASVDGAIAIDGVAGGLACPTDKQLFLHLHNGAGAVLVGAATVRAERYRPLPSSQRLVVFTRTGDLGTNTEQLLAAENTKLVNGDVREVVSQLDVNIAVLEGGSVLNGQMLATDLVDEVSMTISPQLVASDASRVAIGATAASRTWTLRSVCEADGGYLFLQYLRKG
jgi:riboflavin biosynthesis pyrimidine reductase